MSINIGNYRFEGPYTDTNKLQDKSGIYAILCHRDQKYLLIDVGESANIKTRIENHDRENCWSKNCLGTLTVSVLYTPNLHRTARLEIEQEIRNKFNTPCGYR